MWLLPPKFWIQNANQILEKNGGFLGADWTTLERIIPTKYWKFVIGSFLPEIWWFFLFTRSMFNNEILDGVVGWWIFLPQLKALTDLFYNLFLCHNFDFFADIS